MIADNPTRPLALDLLNIREFTETDWMAFSGATNWDDDEARPVIREFPGGYCVIADPTGLQLVSDEGFYWGCEVQLPTQDFAIAFLAGLPNEFDPAQYGFRLL
jgi:hypothetical protein